MEKKIITHLPPFEVPQDLSFLKAICWQITDIKRLTPQEMLASYEDGWHYQGVLGEPSSEELQFIKHLSDRYGSWLSAMFSREQHQKILIVLNHLNAEFLSQSGAYFGGGTLVSLRHGEHRLSQDIDFMCCFDEKYTILRRELRRAGYSAIFKNLDTITLPREIQADQYGVRFPVVVEGTTIKFEIIAEGLIKFGLPDYPTWSPVACLNKNDSVTEKLLANTDRWSDRRNKSRDLIDLSVMRLANPFHQSAIATAESVYPAIEHLQKAILNFQALPEYREECYTQLMISNPVAIADGLDLLAPDLGLEKTARMPIESTSEP